MGKKYKDLETYQQFLNDKIRQKTDCNLYAVPSEDSNQKDKWNIQLREGGSTGKVVYTSYALSRKNAVGYMDGMKDAIDLFRVKSCKHINGDK